MIGCEVPGCTEVGCAEVVGLVIFPEILSTTLLNFSVNVLTTPRNDDISSLTVFIFPLVLSTAFTIELILAGILAISSSRSSSNFCNSFSPIIFSKASCCFSSSVRVF